MAHWWLRMAPFLLHIGSVFQKKRPFILLGDNYTEMIYTVSKLLPNIILF